MNSLYALLSYDLLDPDTLFHQDQAHHGLDGFGGLASRIDPHHMHTSKMGQAVDDGDHHRPDKGTVKQEGDDGLTSGTQGEIRRVSDTVERHTDGVDPHKAGRQLPYFLIGIVDQREQRCHHIQ